MNLQRNKFVSDKSQDLLKMVRPGKLLIPIGIGLGVASYMLYRNFDSKAFEHISWTWYTTFWLLLALLMVVIRDFAYMWRIRVLTDKELNWRKCFEVIMLWEFASAIAPAILGGGFAFAILIINKERISFGKSISVVMFTSFLDGLFFALIAPVVYFIAGREGLFSSLNSEAAQQLAHGKELYFTFWFIYFAILFYKLIIAYALFVNAHAVKQFLNKLFSFKYLKKWQAKANETGEEMVIASKELQGKNVAYWLRSFTATCISWSARFIIINCIIMAFSSIPFDHFLLYARQVVMGILMIGSPTPGGSGVAEIMFSNFLGEFIDNKSLTSSLALLWRLISYYPYLFVGAIVLPRWVNRVFKKDELLK